MIRKTKNMGKYTIVLFMLSLSVALNGCRKSMDTRIDTSITDGDIASDYTRLWNFGYAPYTYVRNGFSAIDQNLFAAVSDEGEQTAAASAAQLFNEGSWNAFNNPDTVYANCYAGIRAANYFLEKYDTNYKRILAYNRDTITDHQFQYNLDVANAGWLLKEARVLRAYFYFELIKRYHNVPLVTSTIAPGDNTNIAQSGFDVVLSFIVSEIDAVQNDLQQDWKSYDAGSDGRITQGVALALKARVLLYAASPLNNASDDVAPWKAAAAAANDVIALGRYALDNDYRNLFLTDNTANSPETIWAIRLGAINDPERKNYPVGTPGGNSGVTPSENLVAAYEYTGVPDPQDPYANRDPRLGYTVVANNSAWNGRTIEIWDGGRDAWNKPNASRTGYYLRKFLSDDLDLTQNESTQHSWIVFRYADMLLDYAEAMNEAYGPDDNHGWSLTARQAVNQVRSRMGVQMPPVQAVDQPAMRAGIKHERQVELAFEDHRFWDLLRWKDAGTVLNQPLKGIRAVKNGPSFTYSVSTVEGRVFTAPKMYYYPIPQAEISKSKGVLIQNQGW